MLLTDYIFRSCPFLVELTFEVNKIVITHKYVNWAYSLNKNKITRSFILISFIYNLKLKINTVFCQKLIWYYQVKAEYPVQA